MPLTGLKPFSAMLRWLCALDASWETIDGVLEEFVLPAWTWAKRSDQLVFDFVSTGKLY